MLRQQTEETPTLPAEQVRVTPEELSQALAAIETRKQAEASRLAGTIPIDQAVSELHLDSTSDEIWAEVQAQRAKAAAAEREQEQQEQASQQAREARRAARREQTALLAQQQSVAPRPKRRRIWPRLLVPAVVVWVLVHNGVLPHFRGHSTSITAPSLRSLAQVPDGKEVYADDAALVQVSEGKSPGQITVSENATGNRWTMVKIGSHVYLRGYIARADSLQPLQGKALNVYNDADSGELRGVLTSNITIRVDKIPLQKSSGNEDFSGITVPDFQPDPLTTLTPWH